MGEVIITVTWMDNTQETYRGSSSQVSERNNLVIFPTNFSRDPKRVIPLENVRIYTLDG